MGGQDDALLVAPCVQDGPVEVYGFYGNDVLEFNDSDRCGPVSFFGGDGMDTFRVGAMVTVQDYEGHDTIELLQEEGTISTFVLDSVTTVFVDGDAVLMVDGVWSTNRLDIIFHDDHGYDDDDDNNNNDDGNHGNDGNDDNDGRDEGDDVISGIDDGYSVDDHYRGIDYYYADYGDNIDDDDDNDNGDNEDDENDERDDVFSGNDDVYSADDADYGDNIYDNDDNGDNEDYGLFQ